jgi:hypothetical protein
VRVSTTERRCFVLRKALFGSITSSNPFLSKNLRWALHREAAESIGFGAQVTSLHPGLRDPWNELRTFGLEVHPRSLPAYTSLSNRPQLYRAQRAGEESGDQERL